MRTRRRLVAVAASLVIAGCSSQEASPATSSPAVTTLSTSPEPTSATAASTTDAAPAPETTAAVTTAVPSTAAPVTTTPPPSGVPVDGSIPLLLGGGGGGGWLPLGSWQSNAWQSAYTADGAPIPPAIPAGSTLAITGLAARATSGVTGGNVEACFNGELGPTMDVAVGTPDPPGYGYSAVALPAIWPLQPRPVVTVDADVPAYRAAGAAVFAADPIDTTQGDVRQIVVTDLDGDGDEEALVVFEYVDPNTIIGTPGDFSAVLLVDTATGTSSTIESVFVAPDSTAPFLGRYRVLGVADLNGDGRMEVVVHSWYYEGAAALVYEYDGTSLTEVLRAGCGA